jgi:hypothetical protein
MERRKWLKKLFVGGLSLGSAGMAFGATRALSDEKTHKVAESILGPALDQQQELQCPDTYCSSCYFSCPQTYCPQANCPSCYFSCPQSYTPS